MVDGEHASGMTFDEWAAKQDLLPHERRLCREYLSYYRTTKLLEAMYEWAYREETETIG